MKSVDEHISAKLTHYSCMEQLAFIYNNIVLPILEAVEVYDPKI